MHIYILYKANSNFFIFTDLGTTVDGTHMWMIWGLAKVPTLSFN